MGELRTTIKLKVGEERKIFFIGISRKDRKWKSFSILSGNFDNSVKSHVAQFPRQRSGKPAQASLTLQHVATMIHHLIRVLNVFNTLNVFCCSLSRLHRKDLCTRSGNLIICTLERKNSATVMASAFSFECRLEELIRVKKLSVGSRASSVNLILF